MKDLWRFIKSSGYICRNCVDKTDFFLLLPLYTSYISPADYGTYDLYNAYIMFMLCVIFGYGPV